VFEKSPINLTKKPTKIQDHYPKYLPKYSLLKLQLQDYMFRETFVYQVLVFCDCLLNPIKDQVNLFKTDKEEIKMLRITKIRAFKAVSGNQTRKVVKES